MTHVLGAPVWSATHLTSLRLRFAVFAVFLVIGGASSGLLLSRLLGHAPIAVFVVLVALLLARELVRRDLPLPQLRAQVPSYIRDKWLAAPVVYGAILGAGFLTRIPSALFHIYVLAVLFFATGRQGLLAGCVFGVTYGVAVLALGWQTAHLSPQRQAGTVSVTIERMRLAATMLTASLVVLLLASAW